MKSTVFSYLGLCLLIIYTQGCTRAGQDEVVESESRWYKGNLHTHSFWSDGDDFPESIIEWYKKNGYHFVALSDHNTLAEGEKWVAVEHRRKGKEAFQKYLQSRGEAWVEQKNERDTLWVRLKTYEEYDSLFEEEGQFLIIQSEEISDGFEGKPIHVNATNVAEIIEPQGGVSVRDVMQNNVDAVLQQRQHLGIPMFPHINHPNFGWAITAEDLIALDGEQFFEVYNGHPLVRNYGDKIRPGIEKMWDIILTRRLIQGRPLMYGLAVDDSHNYHEEGVEHSNVGRGWVMVKSQELTPEAIIEAMEEGEFYSTTGVTLSGISITSKSIRLSIIPEAGISYRTTFIGTRATHDSTSVPVKLEGVPVNRRYSDDVGEVLAVVDGEAPGYTFAGDELYVRAKIISTKPKVNPYQEGEFEMAWTQPVKVQ